MMLPIDDFIPQILKDLSGHKNLVITAAPGAGKTTRLPPALLKVTSGKVLVLEPRRMAAIAAALRIGEENKWSVGEEVGYQVRFANKSSEKSRLIFMTEALLARQMIQDPELDGVDIVVLDEFHERSMHVDLALGLLRELQELGREIKIIVMSATLEAEKIASFLGNCPIVSVPGKLHPLEIRYQKGHQVLQTSPAFFDQLFQTIKEAQVQTKNNILVFLPGVGEIERTKDKISAWADEKNIEVIPLHGSLSLEEQKFALSASRRQRIILSTNIAESSVTLDGVDTVIDSGLAKSMKQDPRTGFSRLELGRISLSSAIQRSGRAARQYPGTGYRMWNKMDELSFLKSEVPEIQRVDLAESLLFLSAQGVSDFHSFTWFEKPPVIALDKALFYLKSAEALDTHNKLTSLGKKVLQFPLPVRLAKMVLVGAELKAPRLGAEIAALLQEKDIFKKDAGASFLGDQLECDLTARLETLESFFKNGKPSHDASFFGLQTVKQSAQQIVDLAQRQGLTKPGQEPRSLELIKRILLLSFTDRLCRRRGKSERALMVGGRGVKLQASSLVKNSEFFVALNGVEGSSDSETVVSLACGFDKNFILSVFADRIERVEDIIFSEEKGQFFKREFKSFLGLPLDEPSLSPASAQEAAEKLPAILAARQDFVLKKNEALDNWISRLQFLDAHQDKLSDNDQALLQKTLAEENYSALFLEALTQACMGEKQMQAVLDKNLVPFFENVFPSEITHLLQEQLPEKLHMPSGSWIKVNYPLDKPPYLEVRIQEVFGWQKTPQVLNGQIPVTLHLLGPNFRPVQVTANLESFWKNGYAEVRKELRIKYPKHQWPEDPADGVAEAKGRRRT